jgi:apolipoprotein N-acyltransferase
LISAPQSKNLRRVTFRAFLTDCVLLLLSIVFFALPQPNFISFRGFPLFAYVAFVPLFLLIRRIPFRYSFLWGALYGMLGYCVFAFWLGSFHPLAMYVIASIYFVSMLIVVPLLKLADILFPKRGFIVQWFIWIGYEYVKTLGFTGFSYGIIGYSQWSWPVIIQIASIFGVWGVSALVTFPSAWIAGGLKAGCVKRVRDWGAGFGDFARKHAVSGLVWCAALAATIVFGILSPIEYVSAPKVKVALIQPNSDPWQGGIDAYRKDYATLTRLSDRAIADNPGLGLVVWPETAFVPRIEWHWQYREDPDAYELVSGLLSYLDRAPVPFVLGNDDAVEGETPQGTIGRIDYNSAFLFRPGVNAVPPVPERYRKMHLVPFTEHFPYRDIFPQVYDVLVANDTHFWAKGNDPVVFNASGLAFSTPICFEDTFGYLSRNFVLNGANAIVNLTNDAWAHSAPCQYQHLSMAVFRAVENRVPLVRATASGQTCYVDPNGVVRAMADPFTETYLVADIPVLSGRSATLYTRWGDVWGILFVLAAALSLVIGMLTKLRHLYDN